MWFLGMDVGTGGTRAVVVDAEWQADQRSFERARAVPHAASGLGRAGSRGLVARRAGSDQLALAAAPEPHEPIAAIGLTGQMHGAVMLDENGAVLRPSLIWCDTRTQPECDWLTEKIGYEKLIELTCNPALPNFTLTKLLWVKTHEPEIFAKTRHIMCPKDYVRYRLTGEFAIDVQEASGTLLLDVTHRRWSKEVAEAAGIPESWLPKVYESPEVCARISETAAGLTGLEGRNAGGGWCRRPGRGRGGHGHSAAGVGVGDDRHFRRGVCGDGAADEGSKGTHAHVLPCGAGSVARDGRDAIGGAELSLAEGDVLCGSGLRQLDGGSGEDSGGKRRADVGAVSAGRAHAASRSGGARGICGHLDDAHGAAFQRAVLEGVAYSLKDTFTLFAELGIPVSAVRLGGGGARGPLWRKIQAGVYGQAVEVLTAEEGGAFGSALMAGVGAGHWANLDEACGQAIEVAQRIEPDPADLAAYKTGYAQWRKLYPALKTFGRRALLASDRRVFDHLTPI